jgi:hypothetical protein
VRLGFKATAFYASYRAEYESLARLRETGMTVRVRNDFPVPPVTALVGLSAVEALSERFSPARVESAQDREWRQWEPLLAAFTERQGHADVPPDYVAEGRALGRWVAEARVLGSKIGGRQAILTPERRAFLESMPGGAWLRRRDDAVAGRLPHKAAAMPETTRRMNIWA